MLYFPLRDLIPPDQILALEDNLGILSLLSSGPDHPLQLCLVPFTDTELSVVLALLEAYPYYCPYEQLLAHFQYRFQVDQQRVAQCRQRLIDAEKCGVWDQQMRPARNALSRARYKLHLFGIEISSILKTGYMLKKLVPGKLLEEG